MAAFRRIEDRERFLTGRVVARAALSECQGLPPWGIDIDVCPWDGPTPGRPYVAGGPSFSVSHSGTWVLVAVSSDGTVGVDVEGVDAVAKNLSRVVQAVPSAEAPVGGWTPESFARAWTRREAVLKAVGLGLLVPRDDLLLSRADEPASVRVTKGPLPPAGRLFVVDLDLHRPGLAGETYPAVASARRHREPVRGSVALVHATTPGHSALHCHAREAGALLIRQGLGLAGPS